MDLLGKRISVRYRTELGATDVVGRVVTTDPLTLERRDGSVVVVPPRSVVAMRVVPDRPRRSRRAATINADDLTRITSRGWPAAESQTLGEWELRASSGFTGRANSAAVHGDPGTADPFSAVAGFYRDRGLTPTAQVVVGSAWDRRFADAGWQRVDGTRPGAIVQVADLDDSHRPDRAATVSDRADDAWLARYGRVDDPAIARVVLEGPSTVGFVSIDGVAVGRVVVTGEWAGISAVEVDPAHRRQGLARRVVETSLAWAWSHGADKVYLQTMRDNTAAIALYAPFGFTTHHEYRYVCPGSSQLTHSHGT